MNIYTPRPNIIQEKNNMMKGKVNNTTEVTSCILIFYS